MEPEADWVDRYRRATARQPPADLERRIWEQLQPDSDRPHWFGLQAMPVAAVALLALAVGMLTPIALAPTAERGVDLAVLAVDAPLLPSSILASYQGET